MRLIKCHIENFGVLSNFDFDFDTGLTTIYQDNGFGKTTFAVFIKAMFYGFPRVGARNIVENERKRYDPWQGGKYGGFLEFEIDGITYRVTRYFGKTAAKDTFSLLDLTNREQSTRFSEKLGEELFKLDADSFARSTYMPQLLNKDMEVTTSIRAKLSNLVDDTNDLNNYDTAEKKLRNYRAKYQAYRGDGGRINELELKFVELDNKKFQAEQQKLRFQEASQEIKKLNEEKNAKIYQRNKLREKIRIASDQKARYMLQNQLQDIQANIEKNQQYLREMDLNYPNGYPTVNEIKIQRENLSIIQQEVKRLKNLNINDADREIVKTEKHWFADEKKTASDIDLCDQNCKKLGEISGKMAVQMLPEEIERLEILSHQFEVGVPSKEEIQNCMKAADDLNDAQRQLSSLTFSKENQKYLVELKELFKNEVPNEKILNACEEAQRERDILIKSRETLTFSENDKQQYDALKRIFASGVPTEEEIQNKQKDNRRIAELIAKKDTQKTIIQETPRSDVRSASKRSSICAGIGAGLLILGVVCFIMNLYVPGILLLVSGFATLLGAFWLHTKQMVADTQSHNVDSIKVSAIKEEENQELYDLQHALNDFLLRFYDNATEPENKLMQLIIDVKLFEDLNAKKISIENEILQMDKEIEAKNQNIRAVFDQYYPNESYRDSFVQELRDSSRKYKDLIEENDNVMSKKDELNKKIDGYRSKISLLLRQYYPVELSSDLRQRIRDLDNEINTYKELKTKKCVILEGNAKYQACADEVTKEIQNILNTYNALDETLEFDICLRKLRKRFEQYKEASGRMNHYDHDYESALQRKTQSEVAVEQFLQKYQLFNDTPENLIDHADEDVRNRENINRALREAENKLSIFCEDNPEIEKIDTSEKKELLNSEVLQMSEKDIQYQIETIEDQLRELRQERDRIRCIVENIPIWEDDMARIQVEIEEDKKKCKLAECTLDLLRQAKDNLANNYVGKVERGFEKYANILFDEELGEFRVDKDLKLYMDEKGVSREVISFSAGIIDGIMLCMRLALVDALFSNEKPFLIFDDPFVNLDDKHTKRALEILHKIAEEYQIVYLVCNSSRT